jgi:DNA-binding beta-propeller fold protein YncE
MTLESRFWSVGSFAALALACIVGTGMSANAQTRKVPLPEFEVDPFWPKMPDKFLFGPVRGISLDSQENVWIVQDSNMMTKDQKGADSNPPLAECCVSAPPVIEFDNAGNYLKGWGGPGDGYEFPVQIHGIFVDYKNNVWISGEGTGQDNQILKFTREGKFLLQIGHRGKSKGSNDTENVNRAASMYVYPKTNELFVADGYGNRRVIVFDADTGAYKRHWGAYGKRPDDSVKLTHAAEGEGGSQFNLVHEVRISTDELVYVADRNNNRIQVFKLDGTFVKEAFVAKESNTSNGTVYAFEFSKDPKQQFLYVADAANGKIRILDRDSLEVLGSFGRWGRQAGQFMVPHNMATDAKGNLYIAEIREGRIQKFNIKTPSSKRPEKTSGR